MGKRGNGGQTQWVYGKHGWQPSRNYAYVSRLNAAFWMGKRGNGGQTQWVYGKHGWQPSRNYAYWPGAWAQRSPREEHTSKGNSFPAFDAIDATRTQQELVAVQETRTNTGAEVPDFVKNIQAAINVSRKHTNRIHKLLAEKQEKEKQWHIYVKDIQQAYKKEYVRFTSCVNKINKDLQEAQELREASHVMLKTEVLRAQGQLPRGDTLAEATDAQWQSFVSSMDVQMVPEVAPEEAIRCAQQLLAQQQTEAMQLAPPQTEALPRFGAACPSTPPHRPTGAPSLTPPPTDKGTMYAPMMVKPARMTDPYMTSPSATVLRQHVEQPASPTVVGAIPVPKANTAPPPGPAPAQTVQTAPPPGLADQLAAKRAGSALRPFGQPLPMKAPDTAFHFHIEDDDDDDLENVEPAVESRGPSPGLGRME